MTILRPINFDNGFTDEVRASCLNFEISSASGNMMPVEKSKTYNDMLKSNFKLISPTINQTNAPAKGIEIDLFDDFSKSAL